MCAFSRKPPNVGTLNVQLVMILQVLGNGKVLTTGSTVEISDLIRTVRSSFPVRIIS